MGYLMALYETDEDKLLSTLEKAVVENIKLLSQHTPKGTDENHEMLRKTEIIAVIHIEYLRNMKVLSHCTVKFGDCHGSGAPVQMFALQPRTKRL
jgi:hypothetical protein